jgi:hypothetical protein
VVSGFLFRFVPLGLASTVVEYGGSMLRALIT